MQGNKAQHDCNDAQKCLTRSENVAIIPALSENKIEEKIAKRILLIQMAVIVLIVGGVFVTKKDVHSTLAMLSGGAVSISNGFFLVWRMTREAKLQAHDAKIQLRRIYFYSVERFLVVLMLLAMCMATMKLMSLYVLSGFVMGQVTLVLSRLFVKIK